MSDKPDNYDERLNFAIASITLLSEQIIKWTPYSKGVATQTMLDTIAIVKGEQPIPSIKD